MAEPNTSESIKIVSDAGVKPQAAPPTPGVLAGYSYPDQFPYQSVVEVVRIIKGNTLATEKSAFGKHVWVLQGFAQSKILGDPDSGSLIGEKVIKSQDAVVDMLSEILQSHEAQLQKLGPQSASETPSIKSTSGVPIATILKWAVTQLLTLIEQELASFLL